MSHQYNKILNHPDKEELMEKLLAGEPTRSIEAWLKSRYPSQRKFQVSFMTLQKYRKNELDLQKTVLKTLQNERRLQVEKLQQERVEKQTADTAAFQAGLKNYVQQELLDYNQMISKMVQQCQQGINSLEALNLQKGSHLNHQAISTYISQLSGIIDLHRKMIADQEKKVGSTVEEDNVRLTKKMDILIESVRIAFNETNPEALPIFISLVKAKMAEEGLDI